MAQPFYTVQQFFPPMKYKTVNTLTWGAGGNSVTITDPGIKPNSVPKVWVTGTTPQAGQWAINIPSGGGSMTITSSSSENSALPISYVIF